MHHWRRRRRGPPMEPLGLSGQLQMERTSGAGICGWAGAAPARQSGLEAKPAKMSLNNDKSAAPGVGGCNAMKGLTIMSCPAQTEKNTRDCLKITRRYFFMGSTRGGIRLYRHGTSRNSLTRGFSHLAMLDSRVSVVFSTNTAERTSWLVVALNIGCLAPKRGRPSVHPIASRARLSKRSFDGFIDNCGTTVIHKQMLIVF